MGISSRSGDPVGNGVTRSGYGQAGRYSCSRDVRTHGDILPLRRSGGNGVMRLGYGQAGRYSCSRDAGHDVNFCSNLPRRASEIQFSLALLQLSLALGKLYIIIL